MREFGEKAEAFDFLRQTSTATSLESDPSAGATGPGAGGPARSAAALGRLKRAGTLMKTGSIMGKSSRGLLQSGKEGNSADEAPAAPPVRLSSAMRARQAIAAGLPTSRAIAQILEREFAVGVQSRVTLSSVGRGATNLPGIFGAGDATTVPYKQIVVAMGQGAKAGLTAFDYLIRTEPADEIAQAA